MDTSSAVGSEASWLRHVVSRPHWQRRLRAQTHLFTPIRLILLFPQSWLRCQPLCLRWGGFTRLAGSHPAQNALATVSNGGTPETTSARSRQWCSLKARQHWDCPPLMASAGGGSLWCSHRTPGISDKLSGLLQPNAAWFTYHGRFGYGVDLNVNMQLQRESCIAMSFIGPLGHPMPKRIPV